MLARLSSLAKVHNLFPLQAHRSEIKYLYIVSVSIVGIAYLVHVPKQTACKTIEFTIYVKLLFLLFCIPFLDAGVVCVSSIQRYHVWFMARRCHFPPMARQRPCHRHASMMMMIIVNNVHATHTMMMVICFFWLYTSVRGAIKMR